MAQTQARSLRKDKLTSAKRNRSQAGRTKGDQDDAVSLLKADHRAVERLFSEFEAAEGPSEKQRIARKACEALIVHSTIEEEVFYPACREKAGRDDDFGQKLDEAQVEHDVVKVLIGDLLAASPEENFFDAKFKVLSDMVKHHVREEENVSQSIFTRAKKAGLDGESLGAELRRRKQELEAEAEAGGLEPHQPRSFSRRKGRSSAKEQEMLMPRHGMPERDEYGRFISEDDDGYSGRAGYRSRSRYDDDDDRGYRSRGSSFRSSSRRRYEDDDDQGFRSSRSGQGQGWHGDPDGHSEAARRGWEGREADRGGRGRSSMYDDDNGYSSRSRGRSRYERYEEDERGYSSRGGQSRSRSGDDEDDRSYRSSGRRGQGGWFGDPEGHSEASRRGWENRR